MRLIFLYIIALVFFRNPEVYAQVLDNSFGTNGIVNMPYDKYAPPGSDILYAVAQQSDGKLIAAGNDFSIIRYHLNGSVDSSFATNGRLRKVFGAMTEEANTVLIQPDGKIIVSGTVWINGNADFAIARFNPDGSSDSSFNGTGYTIIDVYDKDNGLCAAQQADGKIVLCGVAKSYDSTVILRLNTDGILDTTFNAGRGIMTGKYGSSSNSLNAVLIKPDGKILAGGHVNNSGSSIGYLLLQLRPNGLLDSAFGNNGLVITPNTGLGNDLALQQDGKIVIAGTLLASQGHMVRYMPDGSIDNSFGVNGYASFTHPLGLTSFEQIEIDNNGRIYVAGSIFISGSYNDSHTLLIRLNTDGSTDTKYAPYGIATQVSSNDECPYDMLVQQDGRILMVGYADPNVATSQFCMLRFWPYHLSVDSITSEQSISVFPNPATNILYFKTIDFIKGDYTITSISGQTLQQGTVISPEIDISNIPHGVYILNINSRTNGLHTCSRFLKL